MVHLNVDAITSTIEDTVRSFEDHFRERYERQGRLRSVPCESNDIQIWQCLDKKTGEICSMKVLKKSSSRNHSKFIKEVAILKECNGHPNLLHVRNVYECSKFYYIVTDSIDHPNILQALEALRKKDKKGEEGAVGPATVAVIVAAVLNALVYCHDPKRPNKQLKKQIVHGKIHPKNILVPNNKEGIMGGNVMLIDFSCSKMKDLHLHTTSTHGGTTSGEDDDSSSSSGSVEEDPIKNHKRSSKANRKTKKSTSTTKGKSHYDPPEYDPERGATAKGDMWALGVLTFLLLTGKYPFAKPSDRKSKIQNWYGIRDPNCRDFIQSLLEYNPNDRPSAKELNQEKTKSAGDKKKKSWLTNSKAEVALYDADLGEVMYRLSTLNRQHEFQVAVRSYISTTLLQRTDRARLDQIFRVADVNNDNSLSRKEFQKALLKADIDWLDKTAIDSYFQVLDVNGDNSISYTEFLAFAESREMLFEKDRLRAAFDAFDWSQTGYITREDLKQFSQSADGSAAFRGEGQSCGLQDSTIDKMIDRADKDGDGKISFDEFVDMMTGSDTAKVWTNHEEQELSKRQSCEMNGPVGLEDDLKALRTGNTNLRCSRSRSPTSAK